MAAPFIVLEGLDGAGTTTQAQALVDRLRAQGHTVHPTREPSDGPIGVQIRQVLSRRIVQPDGSRLHADALALLFAADRIDHLACEVEPYLEESTVVVSDRYVHSSLAYQGQECPIDWVSAINSRARVADLVLFLDVPVEACLGRIGSRGERTEIFEQREVLERVDAAFRQSFELRDEHVAFVDGMGSVEQVSEDIWGIVQALL